MIISNLISKVLLLILVSISTTFAYELTFLTHFIKPFSYEEKGVYKGFSIEIVTEMMKINKHPISFKNYPFIRALKTVQTEKKHVLFIVARRPEREKTVKWVGPLISSGVYFYKKRGNKINIKDFKDAKKVGQISVGRGNSDHTFLKEKGFKNLATSNNQMQSLQMLLLNRVNLTPISEIVMPEMAKHANLDPNEIERTSVKLYDSVLYLAFSKDVPDKVVQKWQSSLDQLKSSGKYQEIYNRYVK